MMKKENNNIIKITKYMTIQEQIKITEKLLKKGRKEFMILYEKGNNNEDIEIEFDCINVVYRTKVCEQGVSFMRFKPKSSHKDYSNLLYEIRFIIQFRASDLCLETIQGKFLRMYQIFKLIYNGEVPYLDENKSLGEIYLK